MNRKHLVAVALLVIMIVLAGTVTSLSEMASPQQSSSSSNSGANFMSEPAFDSGWLNIMDKHGQHIDVAHNLNTQEILVDITGKQTLAGGEHKRNFGGTDYTPGWSRTYRWGSSYAYPRSMIQTCDEGYALAGWSEGPPNYLTDVQLVRTDSAGKLQWNKTYGGTNNDAAWSVIQTWDDGYAIAGETRSFGAGGSDFYLVKTDSAGNMQWSKTYGGINDDVAYSMAHAWGEGYAMVGTTESFGASMDAWLVKTDWDGNMQWSRTYGGASAEGFNSLIRTSDWGYMLVGWTESLGAGGSDVWLVKTDSAGNVEWDKTYGGTLDDVAYSVVQTSEGGYAIAGYHYKEEYGWDFWAADFWLVKVDAAGDMQWNKTYGTLGEEESENNDFAYSVIQTQDGGYAIAGINEGYVAGVWHGGWLVKTDSDGNMQWNKKFREGNYVDVAHSLVQTGDHGAYVMGGSSGWEGPYEDFWLTKTDVESGLAWTDSTDNTITLYRGATDVYWNFVRVRVWIVIRTEMYACTDPLPQFIQGTPGNFETLHISVPEDLSHAKEAKVTVELHDTEWTNEGDLYVNGNGPIDLPVTGDGKTVIFEIDIPVNYLVNGVNSFKFVYSRSTSSWGYRVNALSLTVVFA